MELGATVCTPKSPSCSTCPVQRFCRARALEAHQQQKKKAPEAGGEWTGCAITRQGRKELGCIMDWFPTPTSTLMLFTQTAAASSPSACTICDSSAAAFSDGGPLPTPSALPLVPVKKPPRVERLVVGIVEHQPDGYVSSCSSAVRRK